MTTWRSEIQNISAPLEAGLNRDPMLSRDPKHETLAVATLFLERSGERENKGQQIPLYEMAMEYIETRRNVSV
jgi:hypothetical protein